MPKGSGGCGRNSKNLTAIAHRHLLHPSLSTRIPLVASLRKKKKKRSLLKGYWVSPGTPREECGGVLGMAKTGEINTSISLPLPLSLPPPCSPTPHLCFSLSWLHYSLSSRATFSIWNKTRHRSFQAFLFWFPRTDFVLSPVLSTKAHRMETLVPFGPRVMSKDHERPQQLCQHHMNRMSVGTCSVHLFYLPCRLRKGT